MKNFCGIVLMSVMLFALTGCRNFLLQGGKYTGNDRGEFAMVYKDLIFLRVKAGKNIPGSLTYWEWGGKYSIDPETRLLKFDMERETGKLWKFSYNIYADRNAVGHFLIKKKQHFFSYYLTCKHSFRLVGKCVVGEEMDRFVGKLFKLLNDKVNILVFKSTDGHNRLKIEFIGKLYDFFVGVG